MVSEYEYDVYDAYDVYDVMYKYIQRKLVLRFRIAWSLIGKYPLEV